MEASIEPIADSASSIELLALWTDIRISKSSQSQLCLRNLRYLPELQPVSCKSNNNYDNYRERSIAPQQAGLTTEQDYVGLSQHHRFMLEGEQAAKPLASQNNHNAITAAHKQTERLHSV